MSTLEHLKKVGLEQVKEQYLRMYKSLFSSVADPHHFDADPDPDPTCHFNADPDPAFHFNADPDPTFLFDTDPNPCFQKKAQILAKMLK
jgi:hypothetical protein